MKSKVTVFVIALIIAVTALTWAVIPQAHAIKEVSTEGFVRLNPTTTDPNGNSVSGNCGGDYLNASATVEITTIDGASSVQIKLKKARPDTLYTVWLRLKGTDAQGIDFGGSPLTGGGSTPLAPSTELDELLASTGAGNGSPTVANGVTTNHQGNGTLNVDLDFPIYNGAYPFQNFEGFDPADPRFPLATPRIYPVAIVVPDGSITAPFAMRIVSHCTDDLGHGLTPGAREPWFDWPE